MAQFEKLLAKMWAVNHGEIHAKIEEAPPRWKLARCPPDRTTSMKTPLAIYALCLTSAFAQTTNTKEPGELVRLRQDYNQKRANSLLKYPFQRRRRDMSIDSPIKKKRKLRRSDMCWNQADMPLLRSFGRLAGGFYKHVAPTALRLGSRTWRVFQQAANALKPIDATYRQQLELLMRNLTSRNQLDAAILVRKELDELSTTDAEKAPLRKALLESKWSWNSPEVVMTFKEDGTVSHIGMHGTWKITGRNEVKLVESGSRVRTFRFDEALQTYKQVEKSDPIHGSRLP